MIFNVSDMLNGQDTIDAELDEKENIPKESFLDKLARFNFSPKEIFHHLNKYVIKQDEAKKALAVSICDHYNHVISQIKSPQETEYHKPNIMILGPTGSGKTYLLKTISKYIGVPFVKVDATKFSETGYVGSDVEDMVRSLLKEAKNDIKSAEYGIIYIDEIDKIAQKTTSNGKDVSGKGVQINLLKLMEETDVNICAPNDMRAQMEMMMSKKSRDEKNTINTKNILFIVSGAFGDLAPIIKKRLGENLIGFDSNQNSLQTNYQDDYDYFQHLESQDLSQYGFEPEFIGRLPIRVCCESLQQEDLQKILENSEGSIIKQYIRDFSHYHIKLKFEKSAYKQVAAYAIKEQTGARGLATVLEQTFRNFKFELPNTPIDTIIVDKQTIIKPKEKLQSLINNISPKEYFALKEKELHENIKKIYKTENILLKFNNASNKEICKRSIEEDKPISLLLNSIFVPTIFEGIQLILEKKSSTNFLVNKTFLDNPELEITKVLQK